MYAYSRKEPIQGKIRLLLAMSGYNPRLVGFVNTSYGGLVMQYGDPHSTAPSGFGYIGAETINYIESILNNIDGFNIEFGADFEEEVDGEIEFIYTINERDGGEKMAVRKG